MTLGNFCLVCLFVCLGLLLTATSVRARHSLANDMPQRRQSNATLGVLETTLQVTVAFPAPLLMRFGQRLTFELSLSLGSKVVFWRDVTVD